MKYLFPAVLLMLPVPGTAQEESGVIAGNVRYLGVIPPDRKIMTTDGGQIIHNDLIVDAKSKGLRYVAVFLENAPPHKAPARKEKRIIDQRDMLFLPRVAAIQEGQPVRFENNDLCNHCVRSLSVVPANNFNVTTPPGQPFDFDFKAQKHPIALECPIHGWMKAYIYVFDHPFFAVTDEKGEFRIGNVPPGKYNLVFHHADTLTREVRPVTVEPSKTAGLQVEWKNTGKNQE